MHIETLATEKDEQPRCKWTNKEPFSKKKKHKQRVSIYQSKGANPPKEGRRKKHENVEEKHQKAKGGRPLCKKKKEKRCSLADVLMQSEREGKSKQNEIRRSR